MIDRHKIIQSKLSNITYDEDLLTYYISEVPKEAKRITSVWDVIDISPDYEMNYVIRFGSILFIVHNGAIIVDVLRESWTEDILIEHIINTKIYIL